MFNDIKCIYTVFLERSFSKAAKKMYISQPALSNIVKKQEEKIGCQIFDRSTIPFLITKAGEYYISRIKEILDIEKNILDYFEDLKTASSNSKTIVLGGSSYFCAFVFPKLIKKYNQLYSEINFEIIEGNVTELINSLNEGKIDIVFETAISDECINFNLYTYNYEYLLLCVPSSMRINNELKEYQMLWEDIKNKNFLKNEFLPVPLEKFKNTLFVRMKKGNDLQKREMLICKNAGFIQKTIYQFDQILTALHVVIQTDCGVLFVRDTLIKNFLNRSDKLTYYKIGDVLAKRKISIVIKKSKYTPNSIQNFINLFSKKEN